MPLDLFLYPKDGAPPLSLEGFQAYLMASGLPCDIETFQNPDSIWITFDTAESALRLTVDDGIVTSAIWQYGDADDPSFLSALERVLEAVEWILDPETY